MRIKIVMLTALVLALGSVGFTQSTTTEVTAQEKKEFSDLILKDDKEVREAVKDGLSADEVAQSIAVKNMDLNKDGQPEYVVVSEAATSVAR
jgi:hypothetical protein